MAQFIPLLLTTADPIDVNVAHIVSYRLFNKNATQITLINGSELYVEDSPEDIGRMIAGLHDPRLDDLEAELHELSAEFDRLLAENLEDE